ncbi:MAG: DUF4907 domain-containing protein, partial [Bacteroidia bacterium]
MIKKIIKNSIAVLIVSVFLISCNNKKSESEGENTAKQVDTTKPPPNPYANAEIEIKVFKNDTIKDSHLRGYGYDIYIFKSLYVHQPHIPAINGSRGFNTEVQAHKAAEFIAYKIKNNIMPPSISVQELDSLD